MTTYDVKNLFLVRVSKRKYYKYLSLMRQAGWRIEEEVTDENLMGHPTEYTHMAHDYPLLGQVNPIAMHAMDIETGWLYYMCLPTSGPTT